jgi:uncharacterized cupredoxin-like copper-binding protein
MEYTEVTIMQSKRWLAPIGIIVALLSLSLVVAACGDGGGGGAEPTATAETHEEPTEEGGTPPEGTTTVGVTVQEWSVNPDTTSVPAGPVTFEIENIGPEVAHEFHVLKTDLEAAELPTLDDGSVDEEDASLEVIEEVHEDELPVGASKTLPITLEAGSYALLCNVVDEDEEGQTRSHYRQGMRVDFEVAE